MTRGRIAVIADIAVIARDGKSKPHSPQICADKADQKQRPLPQRTQRNAKEVRISVMRFWVGQFQIGTGLHR